MHLHAKLLSLTLGILHISLVFELVCLVASRLLIHQILKLANQFTNWVAQVSDEDEQGHSFVWTPPRVRDLAPQFASRLLGRLFNVDPLDGPNDSKISPYPQVDAFSALLELYTTIT